MNGHPGLPGPQGPPGQAYRIDLGGDERLMNVSLAQLKVRAKFLQNIK